MPETFRGLKNQKISPDTPREPKNHARDLPRPKKSKKSAQPRPESQKTRPETFRGPKTEKIIIELIIELWSQHNLRTLRFDCKFTVKNAQSLNFGIMEFWANNHGVLPIIIELWIGQENQPSEATGAPDF